MTKPAPPRLFVIHIMKTAGTLLRRMLTEEFGEDHVFPSDRTLATLPHRWYPETDWMLRHPDAYRSFSVIIGHHPYSLAPYLPGDYRPIIFLRDPRRRSLSMLNHYHQHVPPYQNRPLASLLEDPDFTGRYLADYQTKVLGMELGEVNDAHAVDARVFERARAHLRRCAFVGIAEEMDRSCERFDLQFGTALRSRVRRENVGRYPAEAAPDIVSRLDALVPHDQALYDEACRTVRDRP